MLFCMWATQLYVIIVAICAVPRAATNYVGIAIRIHTAMVEALMVLLLLTALFIQMRSQTFRATILCCGVTIVQNLVLAPHVSLRVWQRAVSMWVAMSLIPSVHGNLQDSHLIQGLE